MLELYVIVAIICVLALGVIIGYSIGMKKRTVQEHDIDHKIEGGVPTHMLTDKTKQKMTFTSALYNNYPMVFATIDNKPVCYYNQLELYAFKTEAGIIFYKCGVENSKLTTKHPTPQKEANSRIRQSHGNLLCHHCYIVKLNIPMIGIQVGAILTMFEQIGHAIIGCMMQSIASGLHANIKIRAFSHNALSNYVVSSSESAECFTWTYDNYFINILNDKTAIEMTNIIAMICLNEFQTICNDLKICEIICNTCPKIDLNDNINKIIRDVSGYKTVCFNEALSIIRNKQYNSKIWLRNGFANIYKCDCEIDAYTHLVINIAWSHNLSDMMLNDISKILLNYELTYKMLFDHLNLYIYTYDMSEEPAIKNDLITHATSWINNINKSLTDTANIMQLQTFIYSCYINHCICILECGQKYTLNLQLRSIVHCIVIASTKLLIQYINIAYNHIPLIRKLFATLSAYIDVAAVLNDELNKSIIDSMICMCRNNTNMFVVVLEFTQKLLNNIYDKRNINNINTILTYICENLFTDGGPAYLNTYNSFSKLPLNNITSVMALYVTAWYKHHL